ncbi:AVAST type 4 anti-phage nuclease Avs4 [Neisseria montereyensis]|uniref:Novel STAND NTPase 3 domain-containing protein n=1 Tax=Neisseria montereyensis TaxID=2973938 RepID=A0ABT2FDX0_9NEIS|nr:AVAST type 4 anti-phage nuclease Avs4 [Neisseria montereyensis]MCS4533939.1 hypothetical protein [Neisseria montereyensis]
MNWALFSVKNNDKEERAFEQMAYFLFCAEFDNHIGLFRYKNQTGIETEPLEKDGVWYGFSAKFYQVPIKDRKRQIIENIQKAKSKNPKINIIYFYVNQELSESSNAGNKKPNYQIDIEQACKGLGVTLEWRVPSHLERQLALPKNKYIYDLFFNLKPTLDQLLDNVEKHNLNILNAIRTSIMVEDKKIEIDRTEWVSKLSEKINQGQNLIISGEGGSGKTAIIKRFYNKYAKEIPICIFKATELNINHISDLFKFDHNFSLADFFESYANEAKKLFIIDSAEKLSEISNQNVLNNLIDKLSEHNWTMVFTTRLSYLDDLRFHLKESYGLKCETLDLKLISNEKLTEISGEFNIELPTNENFKDRIRNLFYLNEYISYKSADETINSFAEFIDLLWKKKIQNNAVQKNNIYIKRGRCFLEIAKARANTGKFYIDGSDLSQEALAGLKQDDILGYDEKHDGYFITHDIYEEWALNRIIEQAYCNHSVDEFFQTIGEGLPIRRAFRYWLSEKLLENNREIKGFIKQSVINFTNKSSAQFFWKDEVLISVLLSDYAEEFFTLFEKELLADNFYILKHILFLLQVACSDVGDLNYSPKPKGKGWDTTIAFIYNHKDKDDFFKTHYDLVLPVLLAWSQAHDKGITTRLSGLLSLYILKEAELEKTLSLRGKSEELAYTIIFLACDEIQDELVDIFNIVFENECFKSEHPYYRLCSIIVEESYRAGRLIQLLPQSIIPLCEFFWLEKNESKSSLYNYRHDIEIHYGLHRSTTHYYTPASAYQTPTWWLLNSKGFLTAIDFIVRFTNKTIEKYAVSNIDDVREITLIINNKEITQFHSLTLWMMYRGTGSPVTPYLLQSMHMALEKFLLQFVEVSPEIIEKILLKILVNAKSSSLTSVVCSIVLAYPNKFPQIALILFSSKDLFHADSRRRDFENQANSLYSIGYGLNVIANGLYVEERLKTCEDTHRKNDLESLCWQYQILGVEGYSDKENAEFIEAIFSTLDKHQASFSDSEEDIKKSILFTRMDKRKLKPKIIDDADGSKIYFSTELTDSQKQLSEDSQSQINETFKYLALQQWATKFDEKKSESVRKYNENPLLALKEMKELINKLVEESRNQDSSEFVQFNKATPFKVCAKLIIEHSDKLTKDDQTLCKEWIVGSIERLISDYYFYQISDGIEECIHALPKLIDLFPKETDDFIGLFILIFFDQHPINGFSRVSDYAIDSIYEQNLWQKNPDIANQILNIYIQYKPLFNQVVLEPRNSPNYRDQPSVRFKKFQELYNKVYDGDEDKIELDIEQLENHGIQDLEVILQILPNNTDEVEHLAILNKILPRLAEKLLRDKDRSNHDDNLYRTRIIGFQKISEILLNRKSDQEIDELIHPFLIHFKINEYLSDFIENLVLSEDRIQRNDNFWYIWALIYPKIIGIFSSRNLYRDSGDQIIINYLLAWRWWGEKQKKWHSLNPQNFWLYERISTDLPSYPAVLYSITRVLYSIGSQFHEEGIDWLFNIISSKPDLELRGLEPNTLFYLENILRKFTFLNREKIKRDFKLKEKLITILTFMVERASAHGYLLRENIL